MLQWVTMPGAVQSSVENRRMTFLVKVCIPPPATHVVVPCRFISARATDLFWTHAGGVTTGAAMLNIPESGAKGNHHTAPDTYFHFPTEPNGIGHFLACLCFKPFCPHRTSRL
jgi:hypothetical protein